MGFWGELRDRIRLVDPRLVKMDLDEGPDPLRVSPSNSKSGTPQTAEGYIINAWNSAAGVLELGSDAARGIATAQKAFHAFGDDPVTLANFGVEGARTR